MRVTNTDTRLQHASQHACTWWRAVYTKVNLDCVRLLDAGGATAAKGEEKRPPRAYDNNNKRYLPPFFLFLCLSFGRSRAVRALPAVPLICRFVCAFKHDPPRSRVQAARGVMNGKRRRQGVVYDEGRRREEIGGETQRKGAQGSKKTTKKERDSRKSAEKARELIFSSLAKSLDFRDVK